MTELLLRLFVKNHRDTENPAVRTAVGKLAGIVGIVCNAVLFLGKLTAGLLCGSVSVLADALNNLSDASSSVITLLAFRMAGRPADKDHPYGHARYEYLSGLIVSILILLVGGGLVKSSVEKILSPASTAFSVLTFLTLICSVGIKLWMCLSQRALGKKIRSNALLAASADSRNDVIATSVVLLSCLAEYFLHINIDGWAGLAVALFIFYSGARLAREAVSPLLGERADEELTGKIEMLVRSDEKFLGVHDLLVHDYGPGQCFASVHVEVSPDETITDCHDRIDAIERRAMEELNVHLVIHCDPTERQSEEDHGA